MTAKDYLIALNLIPGVGSLRIKKLIDYLGSPEDVFNASEKELASVCNIGKEIANRIRNFDFGILHKELQLCKENNINIITVEDNEYPQLLKQIPDPPQILYIWGKILPDEFCRSLE